MSRNYFQQIPDLEYIVRGPDKIGISDYVKVKNFFTRVQLRNDIYQEVTFFDKYTIKGDDRPDIIANEIYKDPNLDWVILLCNNIIDYYSEWPLSERNFENYLLEKYGNYEELYNIHHYESREVKDTAGNILIPEGTIISDKFIDLDRQIVERQQTGIDDFGNPIIENVVIDNPNYLKLKSYYFNFYDPDLQQDIVYTDVIKEITNYQYEVRLQEEKRLIYVLKPVYLNIVFNDIDESLEYKTGSGQFVTRTLKRVSNFDVD